MAKSISSYLCTKRQDCKRKGRELHLSKQDIQQLLDEAGITIEQVGNKRGCYVLGRYNDAGEYTMGNCRFITQGQNNSERDRTNDRVPVYTEEQIAARGKKISASLQGRQHSKETKEKIALSAQSRDRDSKGLFVSS
jgi:hypothetical protein